MACAARCCSRRTFLSQLGAGFGTLALEALARQEAHAAGAVRPPAIDPIHPFAPRAPHFTPRAKSVIFLFMVGGPSQVDTFDYKPQLQRCAGQPLPASIRQQLAQSKFGNVTFGCEDRLLASPYEWRRYGKRGMWVSDLFPADSSACRRPVLHSLECCRVEQSRPASYQLNGRSATGHASSVLDTTGGSESNCR